MCSGEWGVLRYKESILSFNLINTLSIANGLELAISLIYEDDTWRSNFDKTLVFRMFQLLILAFKELLVG